jgi:class 3 adenylate cyclase
MSGFTSMSERLDPEEVKEITSRIFGRISKIIDKYDGFVEKFVGDAVMALFGVPKAHEDDPVRAIRVAREIHDLVEVLSPELEERMGRPLSMHTGINTGLVVTGEVDMEKGTHGVTGDAINLGARLSALAEAGDILAGAETYKASKSQFTFEALKPTKVKGKSEPIPIYKVLSEKAGATRISREMQVSSEMVGRDKELAKLELHILKAVNGQGSVINVFGEPGVGKSRLLAELRQREVISRVSFLEGRSISIGKNLSFHPIIDLFKQWAKIKEDDTQTEASNRLETTIRRVCGDETDEVFPFVAALMGMKLSGKHSRRVEGVEGDALEKLIFKNVRELLIRSTEFFPIVIVMEDLHWADTSSLELLESLFRLAQTHRIVFINVFRSGYWHGDNRKIETLSEWLPDVDFAEISIRPLDRQMGETLINNMLQVKGLRNAVKQQIVERSGGNPFFIEEIIRSFIDEGTIVQTNGAFEVTEKFDQVIIPSTINDVLVARIDRLEEQTRELIKVASVIGRSFFDRILKEVAVSIEGVDERLAYLKDVQFIRDRIRMEELEYLFKHVLAQEAAYESILLQQRKALHRKVAQSIEKLFQKSLHEFYGMLAFHYSKAEELKKAEEYMGKAGEEALHSSASSEALNYFQEALRLYVDQYGDDADQKKVTSFKENLAMANFSRGQFSEALVYFDEIFSNKGYRLPQSELASAIRLIYDLLAITTRFYFPILLKTRVPDRQKMEDCELLWKRMQCVSQISTRRMIVEGTSWIRMNIGWDLHGIPQGLKWASYSAVGPIAAGYLFLGARLLKRAQGIYNDQNQRGAIDLATARTYLSYLVGSWKSEPDLDVSLVDLGLRNGELFTVTMYLSVLGSIKEEQGLFDDVELCSKKLRWIAESYAYDYARITCQSLRARAFIRSRLPHRALNEAKAAMHMTNLEGINKLRFLGYKAIAEALLGQTEAVQSSVSEGELVLAISKSVGPTYLIPFLLGRLLNHINRLKYAVQSGSQSKIQQYKKEACRSVKQALKSSRKYAPHRTWIFKSIGDYYWLMDKQEKAFKWWNRSIQEGERLGARPDLSRTYFEVGKRLLEPQSKYKELNGIDAKGYLEKAEILFNEMTLEKDLDDLERLKTDYGL